MLGLRATAAILLIALAFRRRSGHAAWIHIALLLCAVFLDANALLSYIEWHLAGQTRIGIARLVAGWIVPIICLILAIGGFRGWRWMRANAVSLSF
ncbi:hypothetical protein FNJ84_08545 [Paracoccus sp. M683]|uniref:hypothetical protein n=1 Tax=Paracoccus sp. M683 TaxID=2594268 RepID=UPI00117EA06B|nr:hypothetical protein [Paracoccus sp. M683]TRW97544.1 hypothetical protein FNJ84_08545 [Paracoccus sp. M683]